MLEAPNRVFSHSSTLPRQIETKIGQDQAEHDCCCHRSSTLAVDGGVGRLNASPHQNQAAKQGEGGKGWLNPD
jgi:hypothetical protein